jgi:hypothetical protein
MDRPKAEHGQMDTNFKPRFVTASEEFCDYLELATLVSYYAFH